MKAWVLAAVVAILPGAAAAERFVFSTLEGGEIALDGWQGRPVLVVNTASLCGFTPQYAGLQALYERYRDRGLVVFAVPSDDFNQEFGSAAEVKEFCEVNYGLDLPMADITRVKGRDAHPFYVWLRESAGFEPRWNFNKVLLDGAGAVVAAWGATTDPESPAITARIEALLAE